jgi:phospholipid transport system substrate-binding protein
MTLRIVRIAAVLLLGAWMPLPGAAQADISEEAVAFVAEEGDEMIAILNEPAGAARRDSFHAWLRKVFDLEVLAGMALGAHGQGATPEQLDAYLAAFQQYIVVTYEARFDTFTGYTFQVGRARPMGETDAVVRTSVIDPQGAPVIVDFRVRRSGDRFQVIDVAVEGLSMIKTQRDEFASVIQRSGLDGLIASLNARAEEVAAGQD